MLTEVTGDLFDQDVDALAHGVNCQGLMGAGIAKPFADKYPLMYEEYVLMCKYKILRPGFVFPYYAGRGRWIYNIASQNVPGADAQVVWLAQALNNALILARQFKVREIAMPRIGCGIGGLDYERDALPVFERLASVYPMVNLRVVTLP